MPKDVSEFLTPRGIEDGKWCVGVSFVVPGTHTFYRDCIREEAAREIYELLASNWPEGVQSLTLFNGSRIVKMHVA